MRNLLFITRHTPTVEQENVAKDLGFNLVHAGDANAFCPVSLRCTVEKFGKVEDSFVAVVHPAAALHLQAMGVAGVGVFENGNRAPEGERPEFFCKNLVVFPRDECFTLETPVGDGSA